MATLTTPSIAVDDATSECAWRHWLQAQALPSTTPEELLPSGARAVVVAPHPDDEVLAVGGLLAHWAALGRATAVVAVTDGEASHAGSTRWTAARLADQRKAETLQALADLGSHAEVVRAGLPDGQVAVHANALRTLLCKMLQPTDVLFTTWTGDGHPDHQATGRAARSAARQAGARCFDVPVWGWHWAHIGDARMPWHAAMVVPLHPDAVRRKYAALQSYRSQWERDPSCAHTPVLRPSMLARACRPFELVFT